MLTSYFRITKFSITNFRNLMVLLVMMMLTGILGACKRGGEDALNSASASTAANTAFKTTAKPTSAQASTAAKTASASASSSAADNTSVTSASSGSSDESAGQTVQDEISAEGGDTWAQDIDITVGENTGLGDNKFDLKGRTILGGVWDPAQIPVDSAESTPEFVVLAKRIKAAEKKYNFKMEWYADTSKNSNNYRKDLITKSMAGILFADFFRTAASYDFPNNIKTNIIIPLDSYLDYEMLVLKANSYMYYGSLWKGKHYGITYEYQSASPFIIYNKTVLDWAGQPDILDLVESKQWNWSNFLDISRNCTKDTNGDGIIDQYGLITYNKWYLVKYMLASNGLTSGLEVTDTDISTIIKSPQAIRVFQFISDLCYVYKVYAYDSKKNIFINNKAAIFIHNSYGGNTTMLTAGLDSYIAPMPMGPDVNYYTNINTSQFYAVSPLSKYPEEVANIWAEVCLMWTMDLQPIAEVQEMYEKHYTADWLWNPANTVRKMTTEREYKLCIQGLWPVYKPDFTDGFPGYSTQMTKLISDPLMDGTQSVAQAIDSAEMVLRDIIEPFK